MVGSAIRTGSGSKERRCGLLRANRHPFGHTNVLLLKGGAAVPAGLIDSFVYGRDANGNRTFVHRTPALTPDRVEQIQSHLPFGFQDIPVVEIHPG